MEPKWSKMTPKVDGSCPYTVTVSPQDIGSVGLIGGATDGDWVPHSTVKAMSPATVLLYHVVRMRMTSPAFVDIVTSSL